jgi:hypothetical protein
MARKPTTKSTKSPKPVNAPAPQGQGPRDADGNPLVRGVAVKPPAGTEPETTAD